MVSFDMSSAPAAMSKNDIERIVVQQGQRVEERALDSITDRSSPISGSRLEKLITDLEEQIRAYCGKE
jgi:hypothetical protein